MPSYKRRKDVEVEWLDGTLTAVGRLSDNYHEMTVNMKFTYPDMVVVSAEAEMIRHPHPECHLGKTNIVNIIGVQVKKGLYVKLEEIIGGSAGCTHITNLVHEICYAAVQGSFLKGREDMERELGNLTREQRLKAFFKYKPALRNSCAALSDESPFVKAADALPDD